MKISFNSKTVTIRTAKSEDASFCHQLSQRNMEKYRPRRTYKQYKAEFVPSDTKIIMYRGRRFGYLEYQEKPDSWYLWDMHLSSVLRGQGLGTKLLELVIADIAKKGARKLRLFVYAKNPAVELYKRFGFKIVKRKSTKERFQMEKRIE